jgi:hypothetical protein
MPYGDPWPFGFHIARPVGPSPCEHCGEPILGYIPHRCPGSERVALANAITEAIILLERNGYEVRRKDDPPADEPWRFEPET